MSTGESKLSKTHPGCPNRKADKLTIKHLLATRVKTKNSPQAVYFFTLQSLILPREGQRFLHRQQQQECPQPMAVQF